MTRSPNALNWIGLALAGAGFVVLFLAWDGASELDYIQGQFPYLISGGLTGLGLIAVGAGLLVIQALRRDAAMRLEQLERLAAAMADLRALLAPSEPGSVSATTGDYAPRPRDEAAEDPTEQIAVVPARREEG